jgi:5-methylcytosine-specific restriction endonuclease McrA
VKTCTDCGESKNEGEFYRRESGKPRAECKACFIVKKKANYKAKAPEKCANQRAYYIENREAQLAWHREHQPIRYDINKEKVLAITKQSKAALMSLPFDHPRRVQARAAQRERNQRRAKRKAAVAGSGVSEQEWGALLNKYHHCCAYCFSDKHIGMDHVVPIARGGPDVASNVVPCCRECNSSKGSRTVLEWVARLEQRIERVLSRKAKAA